MLTLTRRVGEEVVITIGEERVSVRVTALDGSRVRLSFVAPRRIQIDRGEVDEDKRPPEPKPGPRNVTMNDLTMRHAKTCQCEACEAQRGGIRMK